MTASHLNPKQKDLHREDIKAALRKSGTNITRLSRENGYADDSLRKALVIRWPATERIIAAALGKMPLEVWPSRYDANGNPKPQSKFTTQRHGSNVQKSEPL
ncbi:MAG: transcriptional regulator [Sphingomonadales bacterium]